MSQEHSVPLQAATLQHSTTDWNLYAPILHPQGGETSAGSFAQQFKHDVDQEFLKEGKYRNLITFLLRREPRHTTLSVGPER